MKLTILESMMMFASPLANANKISICIYIHVPNYGCSFIFTTNDPIIYIYLDADFVHFNYNFVNEIQIIIEILIK